MTNQDITAAIQAAKVGNNDVVTWDGELKQILLNTLTLIASQTSQTDFNNALDGIAAALKTCFRHTYIITFSVFESNVIDSDKLPADESTVYQFSPESGLVIRLFDGNYYITFGSPSHSLQNVVVAINGVKEQTGYFEFNGSIYVRIGNASTLANNPSLLFHIQAVENAIVATGAIFNLTKNDFLGTYYNSSVIGAQNLV
jgi:hypothetical protein